MCILGPRHRCCFMFHHSLRGFPIRWKRHQSQFDWNLVNLDSFGALIWRQVCPSNCRMFIWRVLVCKWKSRSNCFIFVILDEICEARRTYSMMTDDFIYNRILLNSEVLRSCSTTWWLQPIKWASPTTNVKVAPLCAFHEALEVTLTCWSIYHQWKKNRFAVWRAAHFETPFFRSLKGHQQQQEQQDA